MELVSAAIIFSLSEAFREVLGRLWDVCLLHPQTKSLQFGGKLGFEIYYWYLNALPLYNTRVVCTRLGFWKAARECVAWGSRVIPTVRTRTRTHTWERGRPWEMDNSTVFGGSGVEGSFKFTVLRRNNSDWRWRSLALQHGRGAGALTRMGVIKFGISWIHWATGFELAVHLEKC